MHNLPRVQKILRIKDLLDLAKRIVDDAPEHFAVPFASRQSVAVLATERAVVFENQISDVRGYSPHPGNIGWVFEIEQRPDVQAADAGVAIKGSFGAMATQDLTESLHKFRQVSRRDSRVFYKCHRFAVAAHAIEQGHSRTPQGPQ